MPQNGNENSMPTREENALRLEIEESEKKLEQAILETLLRYPQDNLMVLARILTLMYSRGPDSPFNADKVQQLYEIVQPLADSIAIGGLSSKPISAPLNAILTLFMSTPD